MSIQSGYEATFESIGLVDQGAREAGESDVVAGYPFWKLALDCGAAAVGLVLLTPVVLAAILIIRLTSRGAAIYRQPRLGLHGREFTIYKLRTMVIDAERLSGPKWAAKGDTRITPVGRFLRVTHIDELPQLWNVLKGEMSLVGPRPERPEFVTQLEKAFPQYHRRMLVRPGVTGLAQVQLPPDTDLAGVGRKLACDLCYIRQLSLWLDLRILLSTMTGVLGIPFAASRWFIPVPSGEPLEPISPGPEAGPAIEPASEVLATES